MTATKQFFYAAASLALLLSFLILGSPILKPLVFAAIFSVMLMPIEKQINRFIPSRLASILLTILFLFLVCGGIGYIFYLQSSEIFSEFDQILEQLFDGADQAIHWVNANTPFRLAKFDTLLNEDSIGSSLIEVLSTSFSTTLNTAALIFLSLIFLIFLMLYRSAFTGFLRIQFDEKSRTKINSILDNVRHTLVHYLSGLGTVMVIMAILNSIGLYVLGVDYAIFFGVLAAILTIIPFVGTTLGGTLPFLYVLATGGGWFQAFLVVAFYFTIQQIEGNFITPKIVGDSVKVNPFIAILGIAIGTLIWGVAGIILAIPILGILRIVFNEIDALKPIAHLISNNIGDKNFNFMEEFNKKQYRISSLTKKKETN